MKRWLMFVLVIALAAPAVAGNLGGVTLPEKATMGSQSLVLNGMGLRKKAIFKVYVAGLYLPAKTSDWKQVLADDGPRHLVMQWVRTVDKDAICGGWNDVLETNAAAASATLTSQFNTLCDYMDEVRAGDQFVFSYTPESGTSVSVKGADKGTIEGKEFADTLFAGWIGPSPGPGEGFRDGLMGN